MRRFPADFRTQWWASNFLTALVPIPGAVQRVRDVGGGELVVSALRAHIAHASTAHTSCEALYSMLEAGLASSIDVEAAAFLAAAALQTHPSDKDV